MTYRLLTSREVAALTGLSLSRVRQLAPKMAVLYTDYGANAWLWDEYALTQLAARRKAPGSGRRKETK